jgi:hypothetical protein
VSVALAMLDLQLSVDVAYTGDLGLDLKVYGVGDLQVCQICLLSLWFSV